MSKRSVRQQVNNALFDEIDFPEVELAESDYEKSLRLKHAEDQKALFKSTHFFASNGEELSFAIDYIESSDLVGGAATLMSRIHRRQSNALKVRTDKLKADKLKLEKEDESVSPEDIAKQESELFVPVETPLSITRDIVGYVSNSHEETGFLKTLKDAIDSADSGDPSTKIDTFLVVRDELPDDAKRDNIERAIIDLLRADDTYETTFNDGRDHLNDNYLSTHTLTVKRIKKFFSGLTIQDTLAKIELRFIQHEAREKFWKSRLEELKNYTPVKAMVLEAFSGFSDDPTQPDHELVNKI